MGVDFSYISKIENDRMPPPAADTIVKMCEVLGVPPDDLLAMTGKMPTSIKKVLSDNLVLSQHTIVGRDSEIAPTEVLCIVYIVGGNSDSRLLFRTINKHLTKHKMRNSSYVKHER